MNILKLDLTEWDTRLLIEALKELEAKWETISRTSLDEDEQAEYGNDLMILKDSNEKIVETAQRVFGESIATYNRTHFGERVRDGIALLPVKRGSTQVTSELVKQLSEDLD